MTRTTGLWNRATPRARRIARAVFAFVAVLGACERGEERSPWVFSPKLEPQGSGTGARLIGISVVDDSVVWVSGTDGTWARTVDGGATWTSSVVAGADTLQFRDVHGVDARNAFLLSIGPGEQSRIYRTADGGATWTTQFTNTDENGFFDCFDFWDPMHGIAFSDSFEGQFLLIETMDGGTTWTRIPPDRLPPANEGEGGFAASGTCLVAHGDSTAWIGTGASDGGARVLRTTDRGRTWSVVETPLVKSGSGGIFTVAFRDSVNGAVLGGDNALPEAVTDNVALTQDGGTTWALGGRPSFPGAAYGSAWVPGAPAPTLVAVGPRGISYSTNAGRHWLRLDTLDHWAVSFAAPDRGWAVGPGGRISRIGIFELRPDG